MNPGATARPRASISTVPWCESRLPTARMLPFVIATSSSRPGPPSPSKTVPLRMTMSASARERSRSDGAPASTAAAVVVEVRRKSRRVVMVGENGPRELLLVPSSRNRSRSV